MRAYLAALERRAYQDAMKALDDAIAWEPALVEPRHRRARLWRILGDYVRAAHDDAACAAIDPRYREREATALAIGRLVEAYQDAPALGRPVDPAGCRDPELRLVVERSAAEAASRRAVLTRPSCDLPCPSLCCHFEGEMFEYGVHLTPGELAAVRTFLQASGLAEDDYLARIAKSNCPSEARGHDEWFVAGEGGEDCLYYVLRGQQVAGSMDAWHPRTLRCTEPLWLTSRSRRCLFAGEKGCAVHDIGDPPGVAVCRSFVCATAFVFLLLRHLRITSTGEWAARPMADLDEVALRVLPVLDAAESSPEVVSAKNAARDALAAAIAADRAGDGIEVEAALARFASAREVVEAAAARGRTAAADIVNGLLERSE